MTDIVRANQVVPDAFAATLRQMYADVLRRPRRSRERREADRRLDGFLLAANEAGWTATALAFPLSITREWVRRRIERAVPVEGLPVVPAPPVRPEPLPPVIEPQPALADGEVAELRAMAAIASQVNGATAVDHPTRRISEKYSARLAGHVADGFSTSYLARVVGVTASAIAFRLARHGHRPLAPSMAARSDQTYRNRRVGDPNGRAAA